LQSYFRLDDDINAIYGEISQDKRVADMVARYPGLRVLRQEPWECLIAFICSANSNIPRIAQNMEKLASHYGSPIALDGAVRHAFPTPVQLAEAGEMELRALGLGFRAPYVAQAALLVANGELDLDWLVRLPYADAKVRLMECPGVGPKVADCVLVFSLEKLEAFPIDVWVRRALGEWYFPGQKVPPDRVLLEWAQHHFGRYAGYAQQYLFHGRRMER
jgi:N-glycosylase/DNA lyase